MNYEEINNLLALAKIRMYRFDNNLKNHVLIEELENKYRKNKYLHSYSIIQIKYFLKSIRQGKKYFFQTERISKIEHINLDKKLQGRLDFEKKYKKIQKIKKCIFIVGSPRSGSSFLYNLLAYYKQFSYFTNISHFRWPLYNLRKNKIKFIHNYKKDILNVDTKKLRLRNNIVLPAECEYIFDKSIKVYDHIKGHEYKIILPKVLNNKLLKININKHILFFNKKYFLCKSPLNTFRIDIINKIFKNSYFIHLYRNGYHVTESIKENDFKYFKRRHGNILINPPHNWIQFIKEVIKYKDKVKLYNIKYEDLIKNPNTTIKSLFQWLGVKVPTKKIGLLKFQSKRKLINFYPKNKLIDKYNSLG